jgi:tetratricopeptide (TPR) repeat protein
MHHDDSMRAVWAGALGVALAGVGAWAGQRLGGSAEIAGIGAAVGAVSGAFAPGVTSLILVRMAAREALAAAAELPPDVVQPSRLLDPRRGVVGFTGRHSEVSQLIAWCEEAEAPEMRLVTGAGGVGKSRLALHLADRMREVGWRCEYIGPGQERDIVATVRAAISRATLLVIDYAETRPGLEELLRAVAADRAKGGLPPLRVLLLARSAGQWWEKLGANEPALRDLLDAARRRDISLSPALDDDLTEEMLIRQAVPAFARELGVAVPEHVEIVSVAGRARVLELHAAALVAVLDSLDVPARSVMHVDIGDVLGKLLGHEERLWGKSAALLGLSDGPAGLTPAQMRQLVAAASFLGAADESGAMDMVSRVPGVPPAAKITAWLRELYPPEDGDGEWLGALKPDRLAEYLVVMQLDRSAAFAERCLTGLDERQARRVLILLARAAADHDTAKPYLSGLLPLVSGVIADLKVPHEVLASIANVMPRESLALAEANAVLSRRVVDTLPPGAHPLIRAWRLENLALALSDNGCSAEALPLIEQAVAIFRSLAAADPEHLAFFIPGALLNLGHCLLSVSRPEDALNADQEALVLFRGLAAADPGHRKGVASSLLNTGTCLAELGRTAEAVPCDEESVTIWRDLTADEPGRHDECLAMALDNLGGDYSAMGRAADAFLCTEEALRIHRGLAAANPDRYQAGLARCLANSGGRLLNLGHEAEAGRLFREALEVYRSVAAASPGIARSYGLVHSLGTIGSSLYQISGPAESLPVAEEEVSLWRALVNTYPGYRRELARSLNNLSVLLSELGRPADGLPAAEESVTICRELAAEDPRRRLDLAVFLSNLATGQALLGNHIDAGRVFSAALEIWQDPASAGHGRRADVARTFLKLALCREELGDLSEAAGLARKAVRIWRELTTDDARYRHDLAETLEMLALWSWDTGNPDEAVAARKQAIVVFRNLATTPELRQRLAYCLNNLSMWHLVRGKVGEALAASGEAITLLRALEGDVDTTLLVSVLGRFSLALISAGRLDDALQPAEEAVSICRDLAAAGYGGTQPELARALSNLALLLNDLGRPAEALPVITEAVSAWHSLETATPGHYGADLARSLTSRLKILSSLGGTTGPQR